MHLLPDESRQIARLFGFLRHGEWLARDVAARQARLAADPALRRFFAAQARQEAFHAAVFDGAVHWLAPRGVRPPAPAPLRRYRARVEAALACGDLVESLLALQVLFEALGDVVLEAIDAGIERRGGGFTRLRRVLRAQEQAHHAFGVRALEQQLDAMPASVARLREPARGYVELVGEILHSLEGVFADFRQEPAECLHRFRQRLPAWAGAA